MKKKFLLAALLLIPTNVALLPLNCSLASLQSASARQEARPFPAPWRPNLADPAGGPTTPAKSIVNQPTNPNQTSTNGNASSSNASEQSKWNGRQTTDPTDQRTAQVQGLGSTRSFDSTRAANDQETPGVTRVTKTLTQLPRGAGQVWREYDISPYTSRIKTTENPEKAILDWILRETGTEMWFTQPMGVLNVDKDKVYVYHTPEIHGIVKGIVDRFVHTKGQVQAIDVNLITIAKPNWRTQAYTMLQPIDVKSPGVEAWLVSKENAAILMGQLSRRSDYRRHSGGRLTNHDGQSFTLNKTRPVQFIRNLRWVPNQNPNFQPLLTTLNEGYKLQLSCLTSVDNASIEATIKCDVDQVEKLNNVRIDIPTVGGVQPMTLQIPQLVSWRLHERFRWPSDEVLVLSCGVVASPEPDAKTTGFRIPGLATNKRADALLFIDYRGPATGATIPQTANGSRLRRIER